MEFPVEGGRVVDRVDELDEQITGGEAVLGHVDDLLGVEEQSGEDAGFEDFGFAVLTADDVGDDLAQPPAVFLFGGDLEDEDLPRVEVDAGQLGEGDDLAGPVRPPGGRRPDAGRL